MIISPCYNLITKTDCPDRKVGCSSKCEKWKKYEAMRNEEYERRQMEYAACPKHKNISYKKKLGEKRDYDE